MLPTIDLCGHSVTRLVCGGNPLSGFSHVSNELDREMIEYYSMPNIFKLLDDCWKNGINTFQSRGDRHQMRAYLEHLQKGGQLQWIAQTASEFRDIRANVREIAEYDPIAIYNHGTHTDNCWHLGKIDDVRAIIEEIKELGLPAGLGTHQPQVVEYAEENGWPVDFYMCCFYNLARGYKSAPATDRNAYAKDRYPAEDPAAMTAVMRSVAKPCLGFKIMAASRNCTTPECTKSAFEFAFANIKPTDAVVVGMFPKYRDQVTENAGFVREVLAESPAAT
jgi:hypothetical protein